MRKRDKQKGIFMSDDFEDLKRKEKYERQKQEMLAKATGNFLGKVIGFWFVFLASFTFVGMLAQRVFGFTYGEAMVIAFISIFITFKITYVRAYPYKSLVVILFLFGLLYVATS